MRIKDVLFVKSSDHRNACPKPDKPEFAFIGRSNVGKSSLINMLMGKKKLAKTSSTPGKTQLINHFIVNDNWYLVDLPGYGWARTSKENKYKWEKMIRSYLMHRENLSCVFILIDIRLTIQPIDEDFIKWMGEQGVPFALVFTKADKVSKNKAHGAIQRYQHALLKDWEELPATFYSSAVDGTGKDQILSYIENVLDEIPS